MNILVHKQLRKAAVSPFSCSLPNSATSTEISHLKSGRARAGLLSSHVNALLLTLRGNLWWLVTLITAFQRFSVFADYL